MISFKSRFGPLRYATDAYEQEYYGGLTSWQANVRAIALALEALRAVDRYGVSKRGEQYTGWKAIEAPRAGHFADAAAAEAWMRTYAGDSLHLAGPGGRIDRMPLRDLYRAMARLMHPDVGHPRADWDRLDEARRLLAEAGKL